MKKITLLIASLLLTIGAMAQKEITDITQLSNDKVYFIKSARCFLAYIPSKSETLCTSNAQNVSITENMEDPNQQFYIEKDGSNYYLKSVGADKYVTQNGSFALSKSGALNLTKVDGEYPWLLGIGSNYLNSQEPGQMQNGIVVNSWGANANEKDEGNCYKIIEFDNTAVDVTFKYYEGDATEPFATKNVRFAKDKEIAISDIPTALDYFKNVSLRNDNDNIANEGDVFEVVCEPEFPFEFATEENGVVYGKWYKMTAQGQHKIVYTETNTANNNLTGNNQHRALFSDDNTGDNACWAFVRVEGTLNEFKIYNLARNGVTLCAVKHGTQSNKENYNWGMLYVDNIEGAINQFIVCKNGSNGFNIQIPPRLINNNNATCGNHINGEFGFWSAGNTNPLSSGNSSITVEFAKETAPAVPTSYTLSQLTASDLMSKTEPTYIAVKNVSGTNQWWFAATSNKQNFSKDVLLVWEPIDAGNSYRIKTPAGKYIKATSPITLGSAEEAAVFTAVNATESGNGITKYTGNSDAETLKNINTANDPNLVRFVNDQQWINVQDTNGAPKYTSGNLSGGYTIHFVYEAIEVEKFTVNITNAQFATFYAPVNVVLPSNAEAYIVTGTKEENWLNMTMVEGILPANTGVILYSETPVTCEFIVTEETPTATVTGNKLAGAINDSYVVKNGNHGYILAEQDGVIGMYSAKLGVDENKFKTYANKAYLVLTGTSNSASLRFDFGGTTGVEEVEVENDVKVIYDLQGRRVNEITEKGIYIINGNKVLVK